MQVRKIAVLALVVVILIASALLLGAYPVNRSLYLPSPPPDTAVTPDPALVAAEAELATSKGKLSLAFSEESGFYDKSLEVSIFASIPDAKIYYTTDSSEPTSTSQEYLEPVKIECGARLKVFVLKAVAVYENVTTRPLVQTFFVGDAVRERFDTLVFSLSTNREHLYDYDTGIFVAGRLRDEFLAETNRRHPDPPDPANFNWRGMEGERPMYVEAFTPDGTRVVAQAAGARVSGGWSRAEEQKSIRLIARNEYDPGFGKFHYDFFPDADPIDNAYGANLQKYDAIVLRNGANDRNFAMLRNEAASLLARDAGFRVVTPMRAAAVFVNGEYYGFSWLQVSINDSYLQDVYGSFTKDIEVIGDGDQWFNTDNTEAAQDLKRMYNYAYDDVLLDDQVYAEFETLVDVDNLLTYFAFEIYMGNDDWPGGNMKRWRYVGPRTEGLPPELDGRWRHVLYDMDWTLGLYGDNYTKRTFQNVLGGSKKSPLLVALLKRPELAEKFTMIMCDLAANVITEDSVTSHINSLYGQAQNEISRAMDAHIHPDWANAKSVQENHQNMIAFARRRGEYIMESLSDYFDLDPDNMVEVKVTGGQAVIGTQTGDSCVYFPNMTIPVSPALGRHEVFDHWVVDGTEIYEPEITVSTHKAPTGVIHIELVTRYEPPALIFEDAYGSFKQNGCVLRNVSEETVHTDGLFVSDTKDNLLRWEFPAATVAPGQTIKLVGVGSADKNDLGNIKMNFNAQPHEVLFLSDADGNILDYIGVR